MRAWLLRTALVVGFGLLVCLVASLVVGVRGRVDLWGVAMRIEVLALTGLGALFVLIAVGTDPEPPHVRFSGRRISWSTMSWLPRGIPPLDQATGRAIVRQNEALFAGGVVLIALGVATGLLT